MMDYKLTKKSTSKNWNSFISRNIERNIKTKEIITSWLSPNELGHKLSTTLKKRIDKTIDALSQSPNPNKFEFHLCNKQSNNPDFLFLKTGQEGNKYFQFKKKSKQTVFSQRIQNLSTFPKLQKDIREPNPDEIIKFKKHLQLLNGTKESIKNMATWFLRKSDISGTLLQYFLKTVEIDIDFCDFEKKIFICYVVNDILHETVKLKNKLGNLDDLSNKILHYAFPIMKSCFQGYNASQQERVHSLLSLWEDRCIYPQNYINQIGNHMMTQDQWIQWGPWGNMSGGSRNWLPPSPPINLLHLSPGFTVDVVLSLFRDIDLPKYNPIPISHVPPCMPEPPFSGYKPSSYILERYQEFEQDIKPFYKRKQEYKMSNINSASPVFHKKRKFSDSDSSDPNCLKNFITRT